MILHLNLAFLKWGSGKRKNILESWPFLKKFGRNFMAFALITEVFW